MSGASGATGYRDREGFWPVWLWPEEEREEEGGDELRFGLTKYLRARQGPDACLAR